MDELQTLYDLEGDLVEGYGEDALIDNWIDEVLDVLGYGTQDEVTLPDGGGFVDELLFETPTDRREAAKIYLDTQDTTDLFERGVGIVEAKQWDADFTIQFSEQRPYRNASHQTKHYLENTPPNIQWGVLTNGRKWRLYGTNDYETQTYYEVDLPELLQRGDLEAFKYFYVFFRPAAFRESSGARFLDEVWSESETASQELGESLQDNVFTALRVLGRGFVETNAALDIDPDDEEALDELKEQSLVFLYRLMFVLYAESRGLIHPDNQSAQDEYDQNFSLDELRLDIHDTIGEVDEGFEDEFSDYSTTMWSRLEDLFRLIDEGEEDLGIPPYNGGLFDHEAHDFLTDHEVSNQYLAEVIYRLSTTQNDEGRFVLADYADLDTRHLGSVYEGLLEHQFRIAPEQYVAVAEDGSQVWKPATKVSDSEAVENVPEGGLYVVNDEGERKATGAYYTPDYVVTYIVEETVGPLVEEIRKDLIDQGFEPGTQEYIGPFFRRVTDLRILDPAMGSGHFLTKATGYLAEQVMAEVREAESEFGVAFDEQHIRREIAKECIYGVDLNGMAVELAKLSMWLETLAADRPLAFLDHHFKQGNSLVGSDIEDINELESDASDDADSQVSLAEFGATREGTIERLMDIYSELLAIENETIDDVHEMKRKYAEIEQDELRRRLVAMANVHTAERLSLDVPSGAYERMAKALEDPEKRESIVDTDWFTAAQAEAESNDFFHWKLAFPEAFYDLDGSVSARRGFDVILGNPPYLLLQGTDQQEVMRAQYPGIFTGSNDIAHFFLRQGGELLKEDGKLGFIVTRYWLEADRSDTIRKYLSEELKPQQIVDFDNLQVWPRVNVLTVIGIFKKSSNVKTKLCSAGSGDYTSAERF
ncbi:restriction endonuclease, partial [Halorubrum sp. E3]